MSDGAIYNGQHMQCLRSEGGIATLYLDHGSSPVNKFDRATIGDLMQAIEALKKQADICGLIITSRKPASFVVGADITEFKSYFAAGEKTLSTWLHDTHRLFATIEDLPYPSVTAINGVCLGGGMELALTTCYRVASHGASLGLPETKLGIYPGWGGTIRLPRLIGADNAIEWIAGGGTYAPAQALQVGAIDAVVAAEQLEAACQNLLAQARQGRMDWKARRREKIAPLTLLSPLEAGMVFESAKAYVGAQAGPHYPAPLAAIAAIQAHATKERDAAAAIEIAGFISLALNPVADNLVTIFLGDQYNKKMAKKRAASHKVNGRVGVLGAGIMGGGIAYQSASRGVPVLMKDINTQQLNLGLSEAGKLLNAQLERKKIDAKTMLQTLASICPTLVYGEFSEVNLVVEAVVENEKIKKQVLQELEGQLAADAIITSNTSTISITRLAEGLKRPQNFCGLHFFNPVHRMPLVEVIRGARTSEETINKTVAYALKIGKTPIVVNDCPGFLVNRVLFPYFFGFQSLLAEGVDFRRIDKVMEAFGWPMGPAYLIDVIGIDTAVHAGQVMAAGFPERMSQNGETALTLLHAGKRYGQKNGKGFYTYSLDAKGKPKKSYDPEVEAVLTKACKTSARNTTLSDAEIIDRMMLPMIHESARCLEEKIVETPMEVDLGVIYGLGFPPFRGGVLKYADDRGLSSLLARSQELASLGAAYKPAPLLEKLASEGKRFYSVTP